ncbi:iron ABC transporter permease [bacterium]|nr:iron ABC transporter permease [bacterium]
MKKKEYFSFNNLIVGFIIAFIIFSFLFLVVGENLIILNGEQSGFIFLKLRLPSFLTIMIAGGVFAVSGLQMQLIFQNRLATPYTLGVSSAGVFIFLLGLKISGVGWPIFSTFGTLLSLFILLYFAPKKNSFLHTLLLLGVALNIFFSSATLLLHYFSDKSELYQMTHWMIGSIEQYDYYKLIAPTISLIFQTFLFFKYKNQLDLISFNPQLAQDRGVKVRKIVNIILFSQALSLGTILPITGPIAFVGLVVPNSIRLIFRGSVFSIYMLSLLGGVNFLLLASFLSLRVIPDTILPVGVLTSTIGALFLIISIIKGRV